ncbi:unnamed protein product [Gordionus sp. m RMFG-2023]|uniref:periodic tryptophan protein 1 homolog isoform X2 n=1 Tax=Gordionus sp. m RMFG-2023 TaxID=3053472 RepID=UPI0030E001AC
MSLVSCLSWVPRGYAAARSQRIKLDETELKALFNNETNESEIATNSNVDRCLESEVDNIYGLNSYEEDADKSEENFGKEFVNLSKISCYHSNKLDPYINHKKDIGGTKKQTHKLEDSDLDSDELDDWLIKPDDNLLSCGVISADGKGSIETYIYNRSEDSFYIHHDTMLPYLPLSCEWFSFDIQLSNSPNDQINHRHENNDDNAENESVSTINYSGANYLAVGNMKSFIDIWDLDIDGALEPHFTLKHKGGKIQKKKYKGVLSLAWNRMATQILASCTSTGYVNLWDLKEGQKLQDYKYHTDKVNSIAWHPQESNLLLSGSSDGNAVLMDCRVDYSCQENIIKSNNESCYPIWKVGKEIENVAWNDHEPYQFLLACNDGYVICYDCRNVGKNQKNLYILKIVEESSPNIEQSSSIVVNWPRLLTCHSSENLIKIWDIKDANTDKGPSLLSRNKIGTKNVHAIKLLPLEQYDYHNLESDVEIGDNKNKADDENEYVLALASLGTTKPQIKKLSNITSSPGISIASLHSNDTTIANENVAIKDKKKPTFQKSESRKTGLSTENKIKKKKKKRKAKT